MFALRRTFNDPGSAQNGNRGFPAPGSGAQRNDAAGPSPAAASTASHQRPTSNKPTKGTRTFWPLGRNGNDQRGYPSPEAPEQTRPAGSMNPGPTPNGGSDDVWTREFSRGAGAIVHNYGKVFTNPIGAGIAVPNRPRASYGPAAQYVNGTIWWTSQAIPTSVNLQGLTTPEALLAVLGGINVQAAVRVG